MNLSDLQILKKEVLEKANNATTLDGINEIQISYLSKKGEIPKIMTEIKNVEDQDRAVFGPVSYTHLTLPTSDLV